MGHSKASVSNGNLAWYFAAHGQSVKGAYALLAAIKAGAGYQAWLAKQQAAEEGARIEAAMEALAQSRVQMAIDLKSGRFPSAMDDVSRLALGLSDSEASTMGEQGLQGEGALLAVRSVVSWPPASALLVAGGAAFFATGLVLTIGSACGCFTGVGAPAGVGGVLAGVHFMAIGIGLVGAGFTQAEAETGLDIVPWYER